MTDESEGLRIARERIAREAEERTGGLDLRGLYLDELPQELFALVHLQRLEVGSLRTGENSYSGATLNSLRGIERLIGLKILDCSMTNINNIDNLSEITSLEQINISSTDVNDLRPLVHLRNLLLLDISGMTPNDVDLTPLEGMASLLRLNICSRQVVSLDPISNLTNIEFLNISACNIHDLSPLSNLARLGVLWFPFTRVTNLQPIAPLHSLRWLDCRDTDVVNLSPISELFELERLDVSISRLDALTVIDDITPISTLIKLKDLGLSYTRVKNISALSKLKKLERLSLSGTSVKDINTIANLVNLRIFDCAHTDVEDINGLYEIDSLECFSCQSSQISDLRPLGRHTRLKVLHCADTFVTELGPLASLRGLEILSCGQNNIKDLAPLSKLLALKTFICPSTLICDLHPLSNLSSLEYVDCSSTAVCDLHPLVRLRNLAELKCNSTKVDDLEPLLQLCSLRTFVLSQSRIKNLPRGLLSHPSLAHLGLYECQVENVPAEVLSTSEGANCLETLRAHVLDLEPGEVPVRDVKLLVLGNGRVGKTQLCRRLRGETYDEAWPSTHGIVTSRAALPDAGGGPETTLQIWDFGGQDLYHGTHALFMRANAVFLLVWTPALEDTHEETHDGITFRNHPLAYWVDYVRHLGGKRSAVVVVQTRCDKAADEAKFPVTEDLLIDSFGFVRMVRYSARTNRGRGALDEALTEATAWLREQEGIATIGAGRHRVKEKLEALRDADAAVPPAERQYRTISQKHFHQLCDEAGGVHSPEHLLAYLHNAGIVFYRPGLFGDAIILDQNWALDAIYAVFHREKCYRRIRQNRGRFIRSDLADWVWAEHGAGEQELFLSMMQSCGICFEHRPAAGGTETEYIAPELLPARAEIEMELKAKWDDDRPIETATYAYALLHPGLIRSIISRIGREAGIAADYWQGGVFIYETTTNSRGIIEAEMLDTWRGQIRLQTQRGRAAELLARLCKLVEEEQSKAGLTPVEVRGAAVKPMEADARNPELAAPNTYGDDPMTTPDWCVSYAWGGDREEVVDQLCLAAEERGRRVLRDKSAMGLGERISRFMRNIGQGKRVFVILSDKYLKSPFCMFELSEVWRNCRQDDNEFLDRIRIYTLPCAAIWSPEDRIDYAIHWKQRYEKLEARVKEHGYDILGERDGQEFRRMRDFSRNVSDILATVADTLQPRDFDELVEYSFTE